MLQGIAELIVQIYIGAIGCRTLQLLSNVPAVQIGDSSISKLALTAIPSAASSVDGLMHSLFVQSDGSGSSATLTAPPAVISSAVNSKSVAVQLWAAALDGSGGSYSSANISAWDAGNQEVRGRTRTDPAHPLGAPVRTGPSQSALRRQVASFRAVASLGAVAAAAGSPLPLVGVANSSAWRYVVDNTGLSIVPQFVNVQVAERINGVDFLTTVASVLLGLLFINLTLFVVSILYFRSLLRRVASERVVLFSVFLLIPRNVVLKLATKVLTVSSLDEDVDDDDNDDDWDARMRQQATERAAEEAVAADPSAAADPGAPTAGDPSRASVDVPVRASLDVRASMDKRVSIDTARQSGLARPSLKTTSFSLGPAGQRVFAGEGPEALAPLGKVSCTEI